MKKLPRTTYNPKFADALRCQCICLTSSNCRSQAEPGLHWANAMAYASTYGGRNKLTMAGFASNSSCFAARDGTSCHMKVPIWQCRTGSFPTMDSHFHKPSGCQWVTEVQKYGKQSLHNDLAAMLKINQTTSANIQRHPKQGLHQFRKRTQTLSLCLSEQAGLWRRFKGKKAKT